MITQKIFDALPVPVLVAFVFFAVLPSWQSSVVVGLSLTFSAFQKWMQETRHKEIHEIKAELKQLRDRIDSIQIGKQFGR